MARNKERPLFVALTEDDNLVYASEAGMIHWLCERHRIKLKGSIKELEEDRWYEFDIENPSKFTKSNALPKPKTTTYRGGSGSSYYGTGGSSYGSQHYSTIDKLDRIFASIRAEGTGVQLALVHSRDNPGNDLVTKDEVEDAHHMDMLGCKGVFTAVGADDRSGYLYGSFEGEEYTGETSAVMRDVPEDIDWSSGGSWTVKVQGLSDSGNDFILIVSRPIGAPIGVAAS